MGLPVCCASGPLARAVAGDGPTRGSGFASLLWVDKWWGVLICGAELAGSLGRYRVERQHNIRVLKSGASGVPPAAQHAGLGWGWNGGSYQTNLKFGRICMPSGVSILSLMLE